MRALLFALVILSSSVAFARPDFFCRADRTCDGPSKNGKRHGVHKCPSVDNPKLIKQETTYKDGKKHGKYICRDEKGMVTVKATYKNDELTGTSMEELVNDRRYKKTPLRRYQQYKKGRKHGFSVEVDRKGKVVRLGGTCFIEGRRESKKDKCKKLSYGKRSKAVKAYFAAGDAADTAKKNRSLDRDYSDGTPWKRGKLVDGKRVGWYKEYRRSGKLKYESYHKDGNEVRTKRYSDKGVLYQDVHFVGTMRDRTLKVSKAKRYYEEGGKVHYTIKRGKDSVYTFTEYYMNGRKKLVGQGLIKNDAWANPLSYYNRPSVDFVGTITYYSDDGITEAVAKYSKDSTRLSRTDYHDDGKTKSVVTAWKKDGSVKSWYFDKSGKGCYEDHRFPDGSTKSKKGSLKRCK